MLAAATISCSAMMPANSVTTGHQRRRRCARSSRGRRRGCYRPSARFRGGQTAIATCSRAQILIQAEDHLPVNVAEALPRRRLKEKCGDTHEIRFLMAASVPAWSRSSLSTVTTRRRKVRRSRFPAPISGNVFRARFILNGFGCSGGNTSPALVWSNVPAGTKSLSLQVHDPDAPTGSGFWHWAIYDMPPGHRGAGARRGQRAAALACRCLWWQHRFSRHRRDRGNGNYGGPCPPQGDRPHRYVFTLYALAVDKWRRPAASRGPGQPACTAS